MDIVAEDINERKSIEDALHALAGIDPLVDIDEFYRVCVSRLAKVYGTQYALVALVADPENTQAQTQAVWAGDNFVDNFEYGLAGTPCADILCHKRRLIPRDVAREYPEDLMLVDMGVESYFGSPLITTTGETIGLVSVLDVNPMDISPLSEPILGLFAQRIATAVERLRAERKLKDSEAHYRHLVETARAVPWKFDLSTMRFTYVGPQVIKMMGYPVEEWYEENFWPDHMHPDDRDWAVCFCQESVAVGKDHDFEYRMLSQDGRVVWIRDSVNIVTEEGEPRMLQGFMFDISESKAAARQLSYQATHDVLTDLLNRREFEHHLTRLLEDSRETGTEHALLYLDLDQFKVVNDTCGHTAGDELLRQLGALLHSKTRARDILARLGGDEFGVLLESCPPKQALHIAEGLRNTIQDFRFRWENKSFTLGASIGIVSITEVSESIESLLSIADAACYAAKESGRNRIHVYYPDDEELLKRHGEMLWVPRIQQALIENRFQLYTQTIKPIQDTSRGGKHFEILVRLLDEQGKIVFPGSFVPAAERYNLMPAIDRWIIHNVFNRLKNNPEILQNITLCAINLSGHSISDDHFAQYVIDELSQTGIPARKICFEVTETAVIANLGKAVNFINLLKEQGCLFSLDDFGSGMSSFAYLKTLPVDFLKIDGAFVKDIEVDPIDLAMVESINNIGHVMGKYTIAEFVENDAILKKLKKIGVDYAQGYGISRPQPLSKLGFSS